MMSRVNINCVPRATGLISVLCIVYFVVSIRYMYSIGFISFPVVLVGEGMNAFWLVGMEAGCRALQRRFNWTAWAQENVVVTGD